MWGLGNRRKRRNAIDQTAAEILSFSPFDIVPNDEDLGHQPIAVNGLELFAANLFACERCLFAIKDTNVRAEERERLGSLLLDEISDEYSSHEMRSLVIPLLEVRLQEYHSELDRPGEPGQNLFCWVSKMLGNVCTDDLDPRQVVAAAPGIIRMQLIEPAQRLAQRLDAI